MIALRVGNHASRHQRSQLQAAREMLFVDPEAIEAGDDLVDSRRHTWLMCRAESGIFFFTAKDPLLVIYRPQLVAGLLRQT